MRDVLSKKGIAVTAMLIVLLISACGKRIAEKEPDTSLFLDKLEFAGLKHTARGDAMLEEVGGVLKVIDFGSQGRDGVAIDLGQASAWDARLELEADPKARLNFVALQGADERLPASSLNVRNLGDTWELASSFGSPSFDMEIFNGDRLVLLEKSIPNGTHAVAIWDEIWCILGGGSSHVCRLTIEFRQNANGECAWELRFDSPVVFETAEGQVKAEKIVFTENHEDHNHQHEAMIFSEMQVNGANIFTLSLLEENVKSSRR